MKLADQLDESRILVGFKGKTKEELVRAVAKLFAKGHPGIDPALAFSVLRDREEIASTGIGDGLAIPHGKIAGLKRPAYTLALSAEGVDWGSADERPVHIVAAVLAPERSAADPVKLLARLARIFRDSGFRSKLAAARTPAQALDVLRTGER